MKKKPRGSTLATDRHRAERELERLRSQIDQVDRTIVDALMRRSRVVLRIAALKAEANLGGVDPPRERAILERVDARRTNSTWEGYSAAALRRIYRTLLEESRRLLRVGGATGPRL